MDDGVKLAFVHMRPCTVHSEPRAGGAGLGGIPARPVAIAGGASLADPQIHAPYFYYE
ncbi:MAG: hypothetical protein ACRELU_14375 [Gemmatimonadota bacterium]